MRSTIPIEAPGINVAVVKKDADGWRFLLLKRAGTEAYGGMWGLLSGGREDDETVPQLAVREIAEETGLTPESLWASEYCVQFYEPTVDKVWVLPVLVAVVESGAEVRLSVENADFRWLKASEAAEHVTWQNLKDLLGNLDRELGSFPAGNWVQLPIP